MKKLGISTSILLQMFLLLWEVKEAWLCRCRVWGGFVCLYHLYFMHFDQEIA